MYQFKEGDLAILKDTVGRDVRGAIIRLKSVHYASDMYYATIVTPCPGGRSGDVNGRASNLMPYVTDNESAMYILREESDMKLFTPAL